MVYLFAIPLVLGVLPQLVFLLAPWLDIGSAWQKMLHSFAIATLTVGSCLQGIVEIYGTANPYIVYYLFIGAGLLLLSIGVWFANNFRRRKSFLTTYSK